MDAEEVGALMLWLVSMPDIPATSENPDILKDGHIFLMLLRHGYGDEIPSVMESSDEGYDASFSNHQNLVAVMKSLKEIYKVHLSRELNLPHLDVSGMAAGSGERDLIRVLRAIFLACLQSPNGSDFVDHILSLSSDVQRQLMSVSQEVMSEHPPLDESYHEGEEDSSGMPYGMGESYDDMGGDGEETADLRRRLYESVSRTAELERELEEAQRGHEKLELDIVSIKKKSSDEQNHLKSIAENLQRKADEDEEIIGRLRDECSTTELLRNENRKLADRIEELTSELEELLPLREKAEKMELYRERYERMRDVQEDLRASKIREDSLQKKVKELESTLQRERGEIATLDASKAEGTQRLQETVFELEEKDSLLQRAKEREKELVEELERVKEANEAMERTIKRLERDLDQERDEMAGSDDDDDDESPSQVGVGLMEVSSMKEEIVALREKIAAQQHEIRELRERSANYDEKVEFLSATRKDLAAEKAKVESLEKKLERLAVEKQEQAENAHEAEMIEEKLEVEKKISELEEQLHESEALCKDLHRGIDDKQNKIRELVEDIDGKDVNIAKKDGRIRELEMEMETLQRRSAKWESEREGVMMKVQSLESDKQVLEEKLAKYHNDLEVLKKTHVEDDRRFRVARAMFMGLVNETKAKNRSITLRTPKKGGWRAYQRPRPDSSGK